MEGTVRVVNVVKGVRDGRDSNGGKCIKGNEGVRWSRCIGPRFLDLDTSWR
jgi:hypothetical protein